MHTHTHTHTHHSTTQGSARQDMAWHGTARPGTAREVKAWDLTQKGVQRANTNTVKPVQFVVAGEWDRFLAAFAQSFKNSVFFFLEKNRLEQRTHKSGASKNMGALFSENKQP